MAPEWQEIAWFASFFDAVEKRIRFSGRCRYCSQIRRDWRKNQNRLRSKAQNTISSHAKRYAPKWDCSRKEARRRLLIYGWTVEAVTSKLEEAQERGTCPKDEACGWPWDFGEHEMTLDVKDPDALPLLGTNTWVICRTCNTRKRDLRLSQWNDFRAYVRWLRNAPGQLGFPEL